jgi:dienelactone hydrolase
MSIVSDTPEPAGGHDARGAPTRPGAGAALSAAPPVDLDALFAPATAEEIAQVWETFPTAWQADRFHLLGDPVAGDGVAAQFVEHASGGLRLYGALYRPADLRRGPFPLLLANHGGFGGLGPLDPRDPVYTLPAPEAPAPRTGPHTAGGQQVAPRPFARWCWDLAREGYVVLASSYRGEPTPVGLADGPIEGGKGEVDDVLNLLACGMTLPYVDRRRIGMWGTSHGGWITALAAQRSPDLRAGLVYFAPADVSFRGTQRPTASMRERAAALLAARGAPADPADPGELPQVFVRALFGPLATGRLSAAATRQGMIARTVRYFADRTRCPLLLVCGDQDPLLEQSIDLDGALARAGKEHEFRIFPGERHGFIYRGSGTAIAAAWEMTLDSFRRRLA